MVNNDRLFPESSPKIDSREMRTCLKCSKEYPLEHFPIQPHEKKRGIRMHTCVYCRKSMSNVKRDDAINWDVEIAPDPEKVVPTVTVASLKARLLERVQYANES